MALNNTKDIDIHLPNECLQNYPSKYNPEYKEYEFLNCYLYLNDYNNRHSIKYYTGRFKGITTDYSSGVKVLALYKTAVDDFSKKNLYRSSLYLCNNDRTRIECQSHAISLRKCLIWIDKYPIYKKELFLLYSHLLKSQQPLPTDCIKVISEYLKPKGRNGFELFWETYQ